MLCTPAPVEPATKCAEVATARISTLASSRCPTIGGDMLRRSLLLTTFFITLFALLLVAIGFPAQRLFASASSQSASAAVPLSQPVTVTVQQQIPFTITLVTSETITSTTATTETVTQLVTQTTVITFDIQMEVAVSESGVITTPLSIRLRSSQQPTGTFPVKSS